MSFQEPAISEILKSVRFLYKVVYPQKYGFGIRFNYKDSRTLGLEPRDEVGIMIWRTGRKIPYKDKHKSKSIRKILNERMNIEDEYTSKEKEPEGKEFWNFRGKGKKTKSSDWSGDYPKKVKEEKKKKDKKNKPKKKKREKKNQNKKK